jgi:hypothetical protein
MRAHSLCFVIAWLFVPPSVVAAPWQRHTIDDSSRGADGVRLADINSDGRPDITTGWEEGGQIRVYLHPGKQHVKQRWPAVTVGRVKSPEDAVFIDFDGDGFLDVLSSCEGKTRTAFIHLAPAGHQRLLDANAWRTQPIEATAGGQQWMYALPLDVDGRRGLDCIVGSKYKNASVGWLEAPANRADLPAWRFHRMRPAGWVMSLEAADIDGDGDLDLLASDRKGDRRGVFWLENVRPSSPNTIETTAKWPEHAIGGEAHEAMFLDYADFNGDGFSEVLLAAKPRRVLVFSRPADPRQKWTEQKIELDGPLGNAKAVCAADVNLDGRVDLILSCEGATGDKSGVAWFELSASTGSSSAWSMHDIAGAPGTKFDRMELVDLDDDGDLDVLTCEETENLGVIWYENPVH